MKLCLKRTEEKITAEIVWTNLCFDFTGVEFTKNDRIMSRHKYRRVAIGNIEDEVNKSHFAWIRDWSNTLQKHARKKDIRNPCGAWKPKKRRLSISCPGTPIGFHSRNTEQLLVEASEKLQKCSDHDEDDDKEYDADVNSDYDNHPGNCKCAQHAHGWNSK